MEPRSGAIVLAHGLAALTEALPETDPDVHEYQSIITALGNLPAATETAPERVRERMREKDVVRRRLNQLAQGSRTVRASLDETLSQFNGKRGDPRSFDLLDRLLVGAALPPRPLAGGGRGDQLPEILRRQRARGHPDGGPRRVPGHAPAHLGSS